MYEIKPKIFSTDEILSKVSQEDIWKYYLGFPIKTGKLFISPLREESRASANLFYASDGTLLLKDFALTTMNIWQFVQYKYNLTFQEALLKICSDLGISSNVKFDTIPSKKTPKIRDTTNINISILKWNKDLLNYWTQYNISLKTLNLYKVVPISDLWINNEYIYIKKPAFSYEFGKGIRKIYLPFSDKKFFSNVPGNIYSGYDQLDWISDILILTKSHKDVMVYHELGYNAISPQGEGHKIDYNFLNSLKKRFETIIINFDNDKPGINYTKKLLSEFNLPYFFLPNENHVKDISDYIKKYNKENTINYLKNEIYNIKK